jgi:hypothetical protein
MLILTPTKQEQRERAGLTSEIVQGTLLTVSADLKHGPTSQKCDIVEMAGFSVIFDLNSGISKYGPEIMQAAMLDSAKLELSIAYRDPTKPSIALIAFTDEFSQIISPQVLLGRRIGDVVRFDVTSFMRQVLMRNSPSFGFNFLGSSDTLEQQGFAYFASASMSAGPLLSLHLPAQVKQKVQS